MTESNDRQIYTDRLTDIQTQKDKRTETVGPANRMTDRLTDRINTQ